MQAWPTATYHHDPDGNLVELFTEIDIVYDEVTSSAALATSTGRRSASGLGRGRAANKWGPIDPEMMAR